MTKDDTATPAKSLAHYFELVQKASPESITGNFCLSGVDD